MEIINADWVFEILGGGEESLTLSSSQYRLILTLCDIMINRPGRYFDRQLTDDELSQIERLMSKCTELSL